MSIIQVNQACGGGTSANLNVNTGTQCFEGVVRKIVKFKKGFVLDELTEAKWKEARKNKNIVIFPDIETVESDNTDAEIKNGRFGDREVKEGVVGNKYIMELASCTHDEVMSYHMSSLYLDEAEITDKNELICQVDDAGKVYPLPVKSFIVGQRVRPIVGETPTTTIGVKYDKMKMSILKPDFDIESINGIFNIKLVLITASDSEIAIKATSGCSDDAVSGLALTDFVYNGGTLTGLSETDGTYTFSGTGLTSGELKTNVAEVGGELYEAQPINVQV